jgi:hypothetical protein
VTDTEECFRLVSSPQRPSSRDTPSVSLVDLVKRADFADGNGGTLARAFSSMA